MHCLSGMYVCVCVHHSALILVETVGFSTLSKSVIVCECVWNDLIVD